jgi:hypothetical protein
MYREAFTRLAVNAHPPAYNPKDGADFQQKNPVRHREDKLGNFFPTWNLQTGALTASGSVSEFAGCYRQRGISEVLKISACAAQS